MILQTDRLILREFELPDAENLYRLNADPEVIRYTGDVAFKNTAEAESFLQNYGEYQKYGYGRWAVVEKKSGNFIGWCGLKFNPDSGENDLGFRIYREYWNRGFATEAAKACIALGFGKFNMESIIGRAMAANTASIKVLGKIGMHYEKAFDFHGGPGVVYRIAKP